MYSYTYDEKTGGILLNTNLTEGKMSKEPRPVYAAELDLLGFDKFWNYDRQNDVPYMWAEANCYFYRGRKVASIKGGDVYHAPQIILEKDEQGKDVEPEPNGEKLRKIDLKAMTRANRELLEVLEVATVKKIKDVYEKYREKLDCFYVAFSGGKDSIVLFDLVRKTLPSKAFLVVFANTEMEFTDTEEVVQKVRQDCEKSEIVFLEARSVFSPQESWDLFGPPSRFLRWCCTVHKGTPQVLALRKITQKTAFCGMSFVGVRKNESLARSTYEFESFGKKQRGQYSCNPLLDWESSEIWLYTYANNLVVNEAYKKGCSRVGCICCPMGGGKTAFIERAIDLSKKDLFLNQIKASNSRSSFSGDEYILNGGWNARKNGRFLPGNPNVYSETSKGSVLTIKVKSPKTDWQEWIKPLGELVKLGDHAYSITFKQQSYQFECLADDEQGYSIIFHTDSTIESKNFAKYLRLVFRKAAFCIKCGACQANCRNGCLSFDSRKTSVANGLNSDGRILKINDNCTHCLSCFEIQDGCLAYESLQIPAGEGSGMDNSEDQEKKVITINTFSNHAPKREWIAEFLVQSDYLENNSLGPVQKTKFKRFLKDAGLVDEKGLNKTNFALSGKRLASEEEETFFALMMINLVAHNPQIRWYVKTLKIGERWTRELIADELRKAKQSDGNIQSIIGALNRFEENQFGTVIKWGCWERIKDEDPCFIRSRCVGYNSLVTLYGLFVFAEQCGDYKEFTLSTLLDDEIERAGVSPTQIFGLTRDESIEILLGLATNYPEFIHATFTHDLEKIVLAEDKTSQDVLELFKPSEF